MKDQPNDNAKPEAIRRLYHVFAAYRARPDMPACEHCVSRQEIAELFVKPLAIMTADELHNYAWHSLSTIGEVHDFKHFLPRVFELMLWQDGGIDIETLVRKLPYGHWRHWPAQEQEVISSFFDAWWQHVLSHYPAEHEAERCLCAIAQAEDDLTRFLNYWHGRYDAAALQHLAELLNCTYADLIKDEPLGPWWENRPAQMAQLCDWLRSHTTGRMLEQGFFTHADAPFAKELSDALQQWGWARDAAAARDSAERQD